MSTASDKLRSIFGRRYGIAIALLALAATIAFGTSYYVAETQADRARALNLVSHQRSHSQRVGFLVSQLNQTQDPQRIDAIQDELGDTVARLRKGHDVLSGAASESERIRRFISPLEEIYQSGSKPFHGMVIEFIEQAEYLSHPAVLDETKEVQERLELEVLRTAEYTMMQTFGLMGLVLEAEAERANRLEKGIHFVLYLLLLGMIAATTFLIFRPMSRRVVGAFEQLETARSVARNAEEEAKAANVARGHFFQAASHELKTPLNAILGMTDAMVEKAIPEIEEELTQVADAGDYLLTLLNKILDTHRMSAGKLVLEEGDFRLAQSLLKIIRQIRPLAEQKGLNFHATLSIDDNVVCHADQRRLEQIVSNILDNAVKFTKTGDVSFEAELNDVGDASNLRVLVEDTGIGIEEDRLESIFDPYGSSGSMLSRTGGLGVGLALAKELAEKMGGNVEVSSKKGKGSRFSINIPLITEEAAEAEDSETSEHLTQAVADSLNQARGETFNVLVVDDNLANRMVAEALLKPLGGAVTMAADGQQAVDMAAAAEFDLILMDISMPVMDGIVATQTIRTGKGPNADNPIVALTAHVGPGELDDLENVGFSDVMGKPVRKDMIAKCIERWVLNRPKPVEASADVKAVDAAAPTEEAVA